MINKMQRELLRFSVISLLLILLTYSADAQSTNPLNYSGKMYIEAIEIYSTPRYVSYEDHAILSREMRIPCTKIAKCELDFSKGVITTTTDKVQVDKVKVTGTKKYSTDFGWVVVVYMNMVNEGDKAELVWSQYGKPYLQQITQKSGRVDIVRMVLSQRPYVASEQDALMELLSGLGSM